MYHLIDINACGPHSHVILEVVWLVSFADLGWICITLHGQIKGQSRDATEMYP